MADETTLLEPPSFSDIVSSDAWKNASPEKRASALTKWGGHVADYGRQTHGWGDEDVQRINGFVADKVARLGKVAGEQELIKLNEPVNAPFKGLANAWQGLAGGIAKGMEFLAQGSAPFVVPGGQPVTDNTATEQFQQRENMAPDEKLSLIKSGPAYQAGEVAQNAVPLTPGEQSGFGTMLGQQVGGAAGLALGPFAAPAYALSSVGDEISSGAERIKSEKPGISDDEAAHEAMTTAFEKGLITAATFELLPKIIKAPLQKYVVDKFGQTGLEAWLGRRIGASTEAGTLMATQEAANQLAEGKLPDAGKVGMAGLGGAAFGAVVPWQKPEYKAQELRESGLPLTAEAQKDVQRQMDAQARLERPLPEPVTKPVVGAPKSSFRETFNEPLPAVEPKPENTNATQEIIQQEGVQGQPEIGTQSREAAQASTGDSLQRPEEQQAPITANEPQQLPQARGQEAEKPQETAPLQPEQRAEQAQAAPAVATGGGGGVEKTAEPAKEQLGKLGLPVGTMREEAFNLDNPDIQEPNPQHVEAAQKHWDANTGAARGIKLQKPGQSETGARIVLSMPGDPKPFRLVDTSRIDAPKQEGEGSPQIFGDSVSELMEIASRKGYEPTNINRHTSGSIEGRQGQSRPEGVGDTGKAGGRANQPVEREGGKRGAEPRTTERAASTAKEELDALHRSLAAVEEESRSAKEEGDENAADEFAYHAKLIRARIAKLQEAATEPPAPAVAKEQGGLIPEKEMPFNLTGEKIEKPAEETTGFGHETLAQQEMFAIQKIVESKDPAKSADAAERIHGSPEAAITSIKRQLSVIDKDAKIKRDFGKDQRAMLKNVMALLQERADERAAESEYRSEAQAEYERSQNEQYPELLSTLKELGGLPALSTAKGKEAAGELSRIIEATGKSKQNQLNYFRKNAKSLDDLRQQFNERGFSFETPYEMLSAIEQRIATGKEHYGTRSAEAQISSREMGPGAANIEEPVKSYEERKFGKRFVESKDIAQEIRDATGNRFYQPIPNKVTMEDAKKIADERSLGEAINIVRDEASDLPFHVRSAMGQLVIKRLNKAYSDAKAANSPEADYLLNQAADLAEWQMDFGTRLGQGVQSYAMWARMTPEGKLLTFKRAVKKARARHKKNTGTDVEDIVTGAQEAADNGKTASQLRAQYAKNKTAKKLPKQTWEKLLELGRAGLLNEESFYETASEKLGLPNYTPEVAKQLFTLAEAIDAAPEGSPKVKAIHELNKFIATQNGFDPSDLPLGIYYGNILSGYNTNIVNTLDTALNVLSEVNGLAMTNPKAAAKIYEGLLRGLGEGKFEYLSTLTNGRLAADEKWLDSPRLMEIARFGEKGGVPIKQDTKAGRALKTIAESKVGYPLNAYKYVTRALMASDAVLFRGAKEARASLLAHRMAVAEGKTGDALDTRVHEILGTQDYEAFLKQAKREGLTGSEAKLRAWELVEQTRSDDINMDAADFAGEATYNHEPHGTLGLVSDTVSKLSNSVRILKLFVPFTRIVANVTNRGLNYTPVGFKRAIYGYSRGEPMTAEARRLMLTRATIGTSSMVAMAALDAAGVIMLTGNGPDDPDKRKQLLSAGWKPYSIKIGNRYYSYVYTPMGLGLSVVANMLEASRYGQHSNDSIAERAVYSMMRMPQTVFSQSFLSGMSGLFNMLSGGAGESVSATKQFLSRTVGAFTTPNIVKDVYRFFDNKSYDAKTITEQLLKGTVFAKTALRPMLNALGEPVELPRQRFVGKANPDPAWRLILDKNLRIPVVGRGLTETADSKKPMPDAKKYEYAKKHGQRMKEYLLSNEEMLRGLSDEDAQEAVSAESQRVSKEELNQIRGTSSSSNPLKSSISKQSSALKSPLK